jgi:two-component system heavy metal sensor histidine kinase CusS
MRSNRWQRWRSPSIGARLTLLYTVMALLAVALFAGVTNWSLSTNFQREHVRFLQSKVAELRTDLEEAHGNPHALIAEIANETDESRFRQYQARVLDANSKVLGETKGMTTLLPLALFPPAGRSPRVIQLRARSRVYALTTVRLGGSAGTAPVHLQFALDVSRDDALLTDFHRALALAFLLLIPLLALTGHWIAARGLSPLRRISAGTRAITPADLSTRLPLSPPWPSELHELVQVFNAMLARIEEAFSRLSRFSADLAHELRTPLGNLSGEIEVCLMRHRSAEDYRSALESGLEECRRLNVLNENLLFMAHAEHAEHALRCEPFDAAQACSWVVAQLAPGAKARGVTIHVEGAASLRADPLLFRQAVANLLTNAIRHSHNHSEIRIEVSSDHDGATVVQIRDHGEGIEAAHLPHLFDRFYQVDAARRRDPGQGTGLGLSIVKTIVELHGGSVEIRSTPGVGTTAVLRFPLIERLAQDSAPPPMLLDDDITSR